VTASRAPGEDLVVNLAVSETEGSDMVSSENEGEAAVTIPRDSTEAEFTVPTVNNSRDEPDGTVTAALSGDGSEGASYTVAASPKNEASVSVADDDAASAPTLSIFDEKVSEGDIFEFLVELSAPAPREVRVLWHTEAGTAKFGRDFDFASGELSFPPGTVRRTITVFTIDDLIDENPETFEVVLRNPRGATIADGVAVGTIINTDPMPRAWLSRFGRTVAEQATDAVAGRIASSRNTRGAVAGGELGGVQSPGYREENFIGNEEEPEPRTITAADALLGSSFSVAGKDDGGSLVFWGRAARSSFDGAEGEFSLDGNVTTAMLGTDYSGNRWLVGLLLARSEGEGGYRNPEVGYGGTDVSLTAAVPYAALDISKRLKLWGAAGYGAGEVTVTQQKPVEERIDADVDWMMASGELEDMGFAASLSFDPDPVSSRGPSLTLRQELGGQHAGGVARLFSADPLEKRAGSEMTGRWNAEAAYGLSAFGGRYTESPHVGYGHVADMRDYTFGWRVEPETSSADMSFGVKAVRRESEATRPEHTVGFELIRRW